MIGTRTDFFARVNDAYPRGKAKEANRSFKEQCRAMEELLFPADRDEIARWDEDYKRMRKP